MALRLFHAFRRSLDWHCANIAVYARGEPFSAQAGMLWLGYYGPHRSQPNARSHPIDRRPVESSSSDRCHTDGIALHSTSNPPHSCVSKFFAVNAKVGEKMQALGGGAAGAGAPGGGGSFFG